MNHETFTFVIKMKNDMIKTSFDNIEGPDFNLMIFVEN